MICGVGHATDGNNVVGGGDFIGTGFGGDAKVAEMVVPELVKEVSSLLVEEEMRKVVDK